MIHLHVRGQSTPTMAGESQKPSLMTTVSLQVSFALMSPGNVQEASKSLLVCTLSSRGICLNAR